MVVDSPRVLHTSPPDHEIIGDLPVGGPVPVWVEAYKTFAVAEEAWVVLVVLKSCPSDWLVFGSLETP